MQSRFLWTHYDKLAQSEYKEKYGNMYANISNKRDKLQILRFPAMLLYRLLYTLIPNVLFYLAGI